MRLAASLVDIGAAARLWPVWSRLALQDIRLRFRRSWFGPAWIAINLGVVAGAIGAVYSGLFGQDVRTFMPYLVVGLATWTHLSNSVLEGGQAFLASEGYITQIGLPVYLHVFRFGVRSLVVTLITFSVCIPVALICGVPTGIGTLALAPGLALLAIVGLLLTAIFSYLNVRFRDAPHLAGATLQILFLVTPVIWPPDALRERPIRWVVDVNPLYHLLEVVRQPLLAASPAAPASYIIVSALVLALAGGAIFLTARYYRRVAYLL